MGLILWIIFGAIVGFIADYFDKAVSLSWPERIIVGVVGSIVGGTLYNLLTTGSIGISTANGFDLISIVVAVLGALLSLFVYKRVRR